MQSFISHPVAALVKQRWKRWVFRQHLKVLCQEIIYSMPFMHMCTFLWTLLSVNTWHLVLWMIHCICMVMLVNYYFWSLLIICWLVLSCELQYQWEEGKRHCWRLCCCSLLYQDLQNQQMWVLHHLVLVHLEVSQDWVTWVSAPQISWICSRKWCERYLCPQLIISSSCT